MNNKVYLCIDLKSFYASVECVERGLDPLNTNLVVADSSRTEKTICLAVSPSLKSFGVPGRPRLFEVIQKVKEINYQRKKNNHYYQNGQSYYLNELKSHPEYKLDYVVATPRMQFYINYSSKIYSIYLRYIAPEHIHVYSIDEVFMDITPYLRTYECTPKELAMKLIKEVLKETGITATAGIGPNMYLAKVAMDIVAKHKDADENGVRMAEIDEMSYRKELWAHQPLTDFWRVGRGYEARLAELGLFTMGDIARCSLGKSTDFYNEDLLYKTFGINAELLIDHAWGVEPTTIEEIKKYRPSYNSLSTGQVLHCPYDYKKARLVCKEMADQLSLDLVSKKLVTNSVALYIGYDIENCQDENIMKSYKGEVRLDYMGRKVPKHSNGAFHFEQYTSSTRLIVDAVDYIYSNCVNPSLSIRRINIGCNVVPEDKIPEESSYEQMNLFTDYNAKKKREERINKELVRERKSQEAILKIKEKYGKNSIIKGMNLEEGATMKDRNEQIGGHKA